MGSIESGLAAPVRLPDATRTPLGSPGLAMMCAMPAVVTVAIPVLDAGRRFREVLAAVGVQQVEREIELLVCDSGSADATVAVAEAHGARVIEIPRSSFSHGATRNRLMAEARGERVAFLTQDAVPATDLWLRRLLEGFDLAPDVGLVFGPYLPRPDASPMVARELTSWFRSLSPDGAPRLDVVPRAQRDAPARAFLGRLGFFTDANGCVDRAAWEKVPFRDIGYAEDLRLAQDMLRAGYAKAYVPEAAVIHSHDYSLWGWLRRSFDETRAVREVYGWVPAADPRAAARNLWGNVGADWRWSGRRAGVLAPSVVHHCARSAGVLLGARRSIPAGLARRVSLERRPG